MRKAMLYSVNQISIVSLGNGIALKLLYKVSYFCKLGIDRSDEWPCVIIKYSKV